MCTAHGGTSMLSALGIEDRQFLFMTWLKDMLLGCVQQPIAGCPQKCCLAKQLVQAKADGNLVIVHSCDWLQGSQGSQLPLGRTLLNLNVTSENFGVQAAMSGQA